MKMLLPLALSLVSCVPQSESPGPTQPMDRSASLPSPLVNIVPASIGSTTGSTLASGVTVINAGVPVTPTPTPGIGKLEMFFDKRDVSFNDSFVLYFHNKSKQSAVLKTQSLGLIGSLTGRNYLSHPTAISNSGCNPPDNVLPPNAGCAITIRNNIHVAPPKNTFATLDATIDVSYGPNPIKLKISTIDNTSPADDSYVKLEGIK